MSTDTPTHQHFAQHIVCILNFMYIVMTYKNKPKNVDNNKIFNTLALLVAHIFI